MKNRAIEAMKQRAKLYHRNERCDVFTNGIIVRHLYCDMTPETLSFWDDAVFIVNDFRVALWWTHPRYQYHDLVEAEALQRIKHLRPESDPFADSTPNYKKLGRSRKKIVSWTQQPTSDEYRRYFDLLTDMERQVGQEVAFEVRPSMAISWHSWCKGLGLCAPFEVRSEADLLALTHVARRLVKRESTIAQELGDYVYRQEDWLADYRIMEQENRSLFVSHALA
nr:hypothetical protein [uncultured Rhodoferax sp.]